MRLYLYRPLFAAIALATFLLVLLVVPVWAADAINDPVITPATISILLTAGGAPIASAVIWAVIDFLKNSPLSKLVNEHEKTAAFVGSGIVVLVALWIGLLETPPRYDVSGPLAIILTVIFALLAFYNIGRLAMAVHDDVHKYPNSLTSNP